MKNNTEIAERSFVLFCLLVPLTVDPRTWKCIQLMNKLLSIYQPSLKEIRRKTTEKSEDAYGGKEKKSKKDKTLQQQEGLPTISIDLKK